MGGGPAHRMKWATPDRLPATMSDAEGGILLQTIELEFPICARYLPHELTIQALSWPFQLRTSSVPHRIGPKKFLK